MSNWFAKISWGKFVHPNVKQFWQNLRTNREHNFGNHPLMSIYGHDLAKGGYEHALDISNKKKSNPTVNEMMNILTEVIRREAKFRPQLENLSKQVVAKVYGIPIEQLNAQLTQNPKDAKKNDAHERFDKELGEDADRPIEPDDRPELNKRITMNALKQGASINDMMSMHHLVSDEINQMDPQLLSLYDKLSSITHMAYYMVDTVGMTPEQLQEAAGASEELDEQGNIHAVAPAFPFLLQELVKGAMEKIMHVHHMENLDPRQANYIRKHADDINSEPLFIQMGPQLWRKLLKVMNNTPGLPPKQVIVARLQYLNNDELNQFMMALLDEDPQVGQKLQAMFEQGEEPQTDFGVNQNGKADEAGGWQNGEDEPEDWAQDPDAWKV